MPKKNITHKKIWGPDILKAFHKASRAAIREHLQAGNPVYYAKGSDLIKLLPNGKELKVKKLRLA